MVIIASNGRVQHIISFAGKNDVILDIYVKKRYELMGLSLFGISYDLNHPCNSPP